MYDLKWARTILGEYKNVRTRTNNIDICLIQCIRELGGGTLSSIDIDAVLLSSIRMRARQGIWRKYKRINKAPVLDKLLLYSLAQDIMNCYLIDRDENMQLPLFST